MVSILAGNPSVQGSANGVGTSASFWAPVGVAVSSTGLIAVAEAFNSLIRLISAGGVVTMLAGGGGGTRNGCLDGTGTSVLFTEPTGVAFDVQGNLIVTDSGCSRIRKVSPQGVTITLAGWSSGFADGLGTAASFSGPTGIALDFGGNAIVTDSNNNCVRKVTPQGLVTTLAGTGADANGNPVDGAGSSATFSSPYGVAIDSNGRVFVADQGDIQSIRMITISAPAFVLEPNVWHHVALTSSSRTSPGGSSYSAYIDGALLAQTPSALTLPAAGASTLSIGWSGSLADGASGSLFTGALSELRIYNRALNSTEVLALSQPPLPSFPLSTVSPPVPTIGATTYAWLCNPGYFDAASTAATYGPAALVQSPVDSSWAWTASLTPNCMLCAPGSYSLAGASFCTLCAAGTYSLPGASFCNVSSASVGEQTCSAVSQAIPATFDFRVWPASVNPQGVDLIVATSTTCATLATYTATGSPKCTMTTSVTGGDGATLYLVGTAAAMNMGAATQLSCTSPQ